MIVGLVSCGSAKRSTPCAAKDLYTSGLFMLSRRVAEKFGVAWGILSAKHGLVMPQTVLAPYEQALQTMTKDERAAWVATTRAQIIAKWPGAEFLILAGPLYEAVVEGLPHKAPLSGLPIGKRLARLKQLLS